MTYICSICKKELDESDTYEYRGAISCAEHFEEMEQKRNHQRSEIIKEETAKRSFAKGLDFGENQIGKANHKILKKHIEISKKESLRLKKYERPDEE